MKKVLIMRHFNFDKYSSNNYNALEMQELAKNAGDEVKK